MAARAESLRWLVVALAVSMLVLLEVPVFAQSAGEGSTADAVVEQMARAAGILFAGEVTALRGPVGGAVEGIVEVDFRVDVVVRGPAIGSVYTIREWGGLWSAGNQRYRVGQRLLVFLYGSDVHGLSSPVHGPEGLMPLRGHGAAPGPDDTSAAQAEWMVDVRWLQAQALRGYKSQARRPIPAKPIHGIVSDGEDREVFASIPSTARERGAMDDAPSHQTHGELPFARRLPVLRSPAVAPAETGIEPLTQVIAVCQQAIGSSDAVR